MMRSFKFLNKFLAVVFGVCVLFAAADCYALPGVTKEVLANAESVNLKSTTAASVTSNSSSAASADIFTTLRTKIYNTLVQLRKVVYVIAGFGLLMFSVLAIFNKISFKHLGYIMVGLTLLSLMFPFIEYFSGDTILEQSQRQLQYKNYLQADGSVQLNGDEGNTDIKAALQEQTGAEIKFSEITSEDLKDIVGEIGDDEEKAEWADNELMDAMFGGNYNYVKTSEVWDDIEKSGVLEKSQKGKEGEWAKARVEGAEIHTNIDLRENQKTGKVLMSEDDWKSEMDYITKMTEAGPDGRPKPCPGGQKRDNNGNCKMTFMSALKDGVAAVKSAGAAVKQGMQIYQNAKKTVETTKKNFDKVADAARAIGQGKDFGEVVNSLQNLTATLGSSVNDLSTGVAATTSNARNMIANATEASKVFVAYDEKTGERNTALTKVFYGDGSYETDKDGNAVLDQFGNKVQKKGLLEQTDDFSRKYFSGVGNHASEITQELNGGLGAVGSTAQSIKNGGY